MHRILELTVAGLVIGPIGRLVRPGYDPMPIWLTIVIGFTATIVAGVVIGGWFGFVIAVLLAAVLVSVANAFHGSRKSR
jgi:hypothetical protein